jgi:hypothetical protein
MARTSPITLVLPDGSQTPLPVAAAAPHGALVLSSPATAEPRTSAPAPPPAKPLSPPVLSILGAPASAPPPTVPAPRVLGDQPQHVTGTKTELPVTPGGIPFGSPTGKAPSAVSPSATSPVVTPPAIALREANGLPTAVNPTLSVGPTAPVPIGVPNFFIDNFDVPPFLLPIFQSAGAEYQVPWQVLAAINQIETDYGRNLSVSSAGAVGWMQFLPQTWTRYGVDANGAGVADPYNPADAIFAAARVLHAAGASKNLRGAIFAYNHAAWYVDSVMLRARLIGGLPSDLVNSISGLADGLFPVQAAVRYADDVAEATSAAGSAAAGQPAAGEAAPGARSAIKIYAAAGSPVVAVKDGVITAVGNSPTSGKYVHLRDGYGNTYAYSQLDRVPRDYLAAKPHTPIGPLASARVGERADPPPQGPVSAGHQTAAPPAAAASPASLITGGPPATDTSTAPQRLFAHPSLPAAYAAGGREQISSSPPNPSDYFRGTSGPPAGQFELKSLKFGAHVLAGTILGWVGGTSPSQAPHLSFQIRPPGKNSPHIDPKPILDGWQLLRTTASYRSAGRSALFGAAAESTSQILSETTAQLAQQVLADPAIGVDAAVRAAIESGRVDQSALAALAFLSASGLKPTISGLRVGTTAPGNVGRPATVPANTELDISAINGIRILDHQGAGSITDIAIRQLLSLPAAAQPLVITSLMSYPSEETSVAASDHADRITLTFGPPAGAPSDFTRLGNPGLTPPQWLELITRLGEIQNPTVAGQPSSAAILDGRGG